MTFKKLLATFSIWLLLLVAFAILGAFMLHWHEYRTLAMTAVETTGTVIGKKPEQHEFVQYSFIVKGESYSGRGNSGHGNPEFAQLEIGSPVKVFYDPNHPGTSFLGDPKEQFESITRGVIFLAVGGSLFSVVGLFLKGWLPYSQKT